MLDGSKNIELSCVGTQFLIFYKFNKCKDVSSENVIFENQEGRPVRTDPPSKTNYFKGDVSFFLNSFSQKPIF